MHAATSATLPDVRWLVSRRYDLIFFSGCVLVSPLFLLAFVILDGVVYQDPHEAAWVIFLIFTALFDYPHIFQTFSRTHLDAAERTRHRFAHTWLLGVFIVLGLVSSVTGSMPTLVGFVSIFGIWHITRQNIGFVKIYRGLNRHRESYPEWYDTAPYYAFMLVFVLLDPEQIAFFERALRLTIADHPLVLAGQLATLVVFIAALTVFGVATAIGLVRRRPLNVPKLAFMGATLANLTLLVVTPVPAMVLIALETAYHDIQYQGWIRHYQKRRFADRPGMPGRWLWSTLVAGAVAGLIILGGTQRMWLAHVAAGIFMIIPWHYYVDGLIWRVSHAPELTALLAPAKPGG